MTGKITSIEVQKRNKDRVNVYIDEEFSFACSAELVYQHRLKAGCEVDTARIKEIAEEDNLIKAKRDALYVVERSYKTEKEVYDKLLKKGYNEGVINKVMAFMKEYNFIDDRQYVQSYINDKLSSQGKTRIMYDLKKKGIKDQILTDKISNIDSKVEENTAFKLAEKKYNILKNRESDKRKLSMKLSQYMASRGYSWDIIRKILREVMNEDIDED